MAGIEIARTDAGEPRALHSQVFGSGEKLFDHRLMGQAVLIGKDDIIRAFFPRPGNPDILRAGNPLIVFKGHHRDFPLQAPGKLLGKPLRDTGGGSVIDDNGERHLRDKRAKQLKERGLFRLIGDHDRDDDRASRHMSSGQMVFG